MCLVTIRFSNRYDTPDGTRRLSSSTYQNPWSSRMRSLPQMWAQMPPGGSTPTHSRRKLGDPVTRSAGTIPSLTDALVVVAVVDEQVEGGQPLDQAGFDDLPLVAGDDPRDDVERPRSVDPHPFVVDGEGDADGPDLAVGGHLALGQGARAQVGQVGPELLG